MQGLDWETTGRIASLLGAIKIAHAGTQNHRFTAGRIPAPLPRRFRPRDLMRSALACAALALLAAWPSVAQDISVRETHAWDQTLSRIAPSVVTIEIDQTRAFDTEWNQSSQATGFVVDAERGLILTNRHVVTPGPVVATAVFQNREEVELQPVYRDPVHDFGFYRYDPAKLRYIAPPALPLYPEGARIGTEIRVVGNDAGEQLSILAGTLARLDREAPEYGVGKYNDFNTFYIQAASGTSGGSSGSPVIDIRGRVVALNAGGSNGAASSFYLPLGRVQRALELHPGGPAGHPRHAADGVQLHAVRRARAARARAAKPRTRRVAPRPELTGMLVVSEVQPGSAAEGKLQPGDILTRIDGQLVTTFEPLDEILDESVGKSVTLEVERGGDGARKARLQVEDLHAITPDAYLEFGDAVVHTLSYQMARHFNARGARRVRRQSGLRAGCRRRAARRGDHRASAASRSRLWPISPRRSRRCPTAGARRCAIRRSTIRRAPRRA